MNELANDMAAVIRAANAKEVLNIKQILINNNVYLLCVRYYLKNCFLDVLEKLEPSKIEQQRTFLEVCYMK